MKPVVADNVIPTNEYGNVYLFKKSMLPTGCAHVVYPKLRKILNVLKVPHAPAMVGWEKGGFSKPLFQGFVVLSRDEKLVCRRFI